MGGGDTERGDSNLFSLLEAGEAERRREGSGSKLQKIKWQGDLGDGRGRDTGTGGVSASEG